MDRAPAILVIDDEEAIRDCCKQILEDCRYRVETAGDAYEGLKTLQRGRFDLVLCDLGLPGLDGTDFLRRARAQCPRLEVIVMTGHPSVASAVECMRLGAHDYIPKPFDAGTLRLLVGRALEQRRLALEDRVDLRPGLRVISAPDMLQGRSPAVRRVQEMIARVAPADTTVLILGESGTGKELVARAIHRASLRRDGAFLTVDCGALVESLCESELFGHVKGAFTGAVGTRAGRFELADGGTVFLDEIGHIGSSMQGKLLRVLQEREITRVGSNDPIQVDVRIIAATNQDLRSAMLAGSFREDLFYRLGVVVIEIPPLRTRREDIPILAEDLIGRVCRRRQLPLRRLSAEALRMMQIHSWPGNVRELENTLERALLMAPGKEIVPEDLQFVDRGKAGHGSAAAGGHPEFSSGSRAGAAGTVGLDAAAGEREIEEAGAGGGPGGTEDLRLVVQEARHIRRVLEITGWQLGRAAQLLGIDRKTLWRKVREYRLR